MRLIRIPVVAIAMLVGFATGCENASAPLGTEMTRPQFEEGVSGTHMKLVEVNWSQPFTFTVEKVIGEKGGFLDLGDHKLVVSRKAVTSDTRFVFTARIHKYVEIDLHAFRVSDGAPIHEFNTDVELKLDYHALSWMGNPDRLRVVYLMDGTVNGRKENIPSAVDRRSRKVTGRLKHFSTYSMAID